MNRTLHASIAGGILLALLPATGRAQTGGFDVAWHDCIGLPSAAQNLDYACDGSRDGNPWKLVVTFTPPADLTKFVGVQVVMKVGVVPCRRRSPTGGASVLGNAGRGDRVPGSRAGIGTGASGACMDPWASAGNVNGGYEWDSDTGTHWASFGGYIGEYHPGYGLLKLAIARDTEIALQAGQRYLLPPILLDPVANPASDPDSACAGCEAGACLFVYEVDLFQTAGTATYDRYVLTRPVERAFVTWQSGQIGSECSNAVPTRRATWGNIKALYR